MSVPLDTGRNAELVHNEALQSWVVSLTRPIGDDGESETLEALLSLGTRTRLQPGPMAAVRAPRA